MITVVDAWSPGLQGFHSSDSRCRRAVAVESTARVRLRARLAILRPAEMVWHSADGRNRGLYFERAPFRGFLQHNGERVHGHECGAGVTQQEDCASISDWLRPTRQPSVEAAAFVQCCRFVTKVTDAGNLGLFTMPKRSILLKQMCSSRSSRDMFFNDAVGKLPPLCKLRRSAGFRITNRAQQF